MSDPRTILRNVITFLSQNPNINSNIQVKVGNTGNYKVFSFWSDLNLSWHIEDITIEPPFSVLTGLSNILIFINILKPIRYIAYWNNDVERIFYSCYPEMNDQNCDTEEHIKRPIEEIEEDLDVTEDIDNVALK